MQCSIFGAHLLTPSATHGGPRPFADLICHPISRLRAPNLGVQACGSAPLTAQAPECIARPGAPVGGMTKAYGCRRPEAVDGTGAAASHARRKERNAVQLSGGYPGGPPPGHALWVLSLVQEKVPRPPVREPAKSRGPAGTRRQKGKLSGAQPLSVSLGTFCTSRKCPAVGPTGPR